MRANRIMVTHSSQIVILLFIISFRLSAQGISLPANHLLPVVMGPSPTAASLGKYGQWPVNYYTGIPNISIPIYEIKSGDIGLPVSLSYHAGGIKVEDISSWMGTGWDLSAGGAITRTMVGLPDEQYGGFYYNYYNHVNQIKTSYNLNTKADWNFFNSVANSVFDSEPDIYYFNFAGYSGRFFFDTSGTFHAIPENSLKVVKNPFLSVYNHWEIQDDNGTTYIFGPGDDNTTTEAGKEYSWTTGSSNDLGDVRNPVATAWYLTAIISKEKTDTISLQYTSKFESITNPRSQSYDIISNFATVSNWASSHAADMASIQFPYYRVTFSQPTGRTHRGNTNLSSITWRGGTIQFTAGLSRQDLVWAGATSGTMLTNMQVKSMNNQVIKNYNFLYSYTNSRYYLNTMRLMDGAGNKINDYSFNYYSPLPDRTSYAQDHWGYYNGVTANTDLLVTIPSLVSNLPIYTAHADRTSNASTMVYGSLYQINYPTGGRTQFEYEPNQCDGSSIQTLDPGVVINTNVIGGLRIRSIKNYADAGCTLVSARSFQYSTGNLLTAPSYNHYLENNIESYATCQNPPCPIECYFFARLLEITSTSQNILGFTQGATVGYTTVTERYADLNNNDNGYAKYTYSYSPDIGNNFNLNVGYWQPANINALNRSYPADEYEYKRGMLLSETNYTRSPDGSYFPVKNVQHDYNFNDGNAGNRFFQMKALRVKGLRFGGYGCAQWNTNGNTTGIDDYSKDFGFSYYNVTTSWVQKTATTTTTYDQNGQNPLTTQVSYAYNNSLNLQPTTISTTDSKGNSLMTVNKFPNDFAAPQGSPPNIYNMMVSQNMISPIISQTKFVNGVQTEAQINNYGFSGPSNNLILPSSIQTQMQTNPLEARVNFYSYDNYGNVLEQSKTNDAHEVYLYGYKSLYPVAKIIGTTYTAASSYVTQAQLDNAYNQTDYQFRGSLNNLRTNLTGALVSTYTYAPLLGVTGETDPSGKQSIFQYDNAGRLNIIRDKDSNIIKTISYYYAASSGACTGSNVYYSFPQSGLYTKNGCPSGFVGSSVWYTVPAGAYASGISQADADLIAMNQVSTNGQNYANANGNCILPPPPSVTMSCNNTGGFGPYTEVYINTSTNLQYTFTVTAAGGTLGTIPQGTYNLTITADPSLGTSIFQAGCNSLSKRGTTATFTNLSVTSTACNQTIISVL
ncbi:DUF5977 domain-containing protein [Flavitalea flava]